MKNWGKSIKIKIPPAASANIDQEVGRWVEVMQVAAAVVKGSELVAVEAVAGGEPQVEEEWPLWGLQATSPVNL